MKIQISLSAAIDRYMEMFQCFHSRFLPGIKMFIEENIMQFKKEDRILYLCKMYKASLLETLCRKGFMTQKAVEKQLQKMQINRARDLFDCPPTKQNLQGYIKDLQHFYSLDYHKINDYIFPKAGSINDIFDDFERLEKEWKSRQQEKGVDEYGKKLIDFSDGSAWFDLEKPYCKIEGDAMGHCGNTGNPHEGDTVLSYRVPLKNGQWKPLLTFILDKEGMLGEMKGRGNDKPDEKFHPVIIQLLLNPLVRGVKGGGYLPENNFSITDLNESNLSKVRSKLKSLITITDAILLSNKDPECLEIAKERCAKIFGSEYVTDFDYDNLSMFGLHRAHNIFKKLNNINADSFDDFQDQLKEFLNSLSKKQTDELCTEYQTDKHNIYQTIYALPKTLKFKEHSSYKQRLARVEIIASIQQSIRKAATRKGTKFATWLANNKFSYFGSGNYIKITLDLEKIISILSTFSSTRLVVWEERYRQNLLDFVLGSMDSSTLKTMLGLKDLTFLPKDFDVDYAIKLFWESYKEQ